MPMLCSYNCNLVMLSIHDAMYWFGVANEDIHILTFCSDSIGRKTNFDIRVLRRHTSTFAGVYMHTTLALLDGKKLCELMHALKKRYCIENVSL